MIFDSRDKCGVVGVRSPGNAEHLAYYMLYDLQHRGQESAGIASLSDGELRIAKGLGLVFEAIGRDELREIRGDLAIGHVRYSTTGSPRPENIQPLVLSTALGTLAIGHNGDIVNSYSLREELEREGMIFQTTTDSEIIGALIARSSERDIVEAIRQASERLIGAYSLTILTRDYVIGVRDPLGIRPLSMGISQDGECIAISSESCALRVGEILEFEDVEPGSIVLIDSDGEIIREKLPGRSRHAHCMFEYVYFSRADSVIEGRLVYEVRREIGRSLARMYQIDADIVVPIPDSGISYALGYSEESGLPYVEGLMKNRYVWRTFITPSQADRELMVKLKLSPVRRLLDGKRVILMDDSIVRGTTMRRIVRMVKDAGAREVHVVIGCPRIIAPCYYGIDMGRRARLGRREFIAHGRTDEEIAKLIGADSVNYNTIENLKRCIGLEDLCLGCLTGEYPTPVGIADKAIFERS